MAKTALVTGGAGFIGSHLVNLLIQEGWKVRILDNFSTGLPSNLLSLPGSLEVVEGDICNPQACQEACRDVDSVFHLAGIASVAESVADPLRSHEVNLTGTLNLLLSARNAGVRRFVFSSSASVYGNAEQVPTREDQPINPLSPYATAKLTGELYCRNFWQLYGLETVVLRYFNVFGPRQSAVSGYAAAIPKFVQAVVMGESPVIFGDGKQTRDFIYVENVALANLCAACAEGVGGETFNVAGGEAISLIGLLEELNQITGATVAPRFEPARAGDVRHSRADISRARQLLGYEPVISFGEGLRRTVSASRAELTAPRFYTSSMGALALGGDVK